MRVAAGVDLGGTAINYTFVDGSGRFLIDGLFEHPARSKDGPAICLQQIADGLALAAKHAGVQMADVAMVGLDTPGPASADGVLSARGSTNFVHADWAGFDIRHGLEAKLERRVVYLNDGNAAALWGHVAIFGPASDATSISAIIGTGLGGGVITSGNSVVRGRRGFGGELGHVLVPYQSIAGIDGMRPQCNCLRTGDLESLCSLTAIERTLLPDVLARDPHHELHRSATPHEAAKRVRGLAEGGDALCRRVFQIQAHALGLFLDEMVNVFDPDAFIVGGGAIETGPEFQRWFLDEIRAGMPAQRGEQAGIPIHLMPNGDCAGARGAAIEALGRLRVA